MPLLPINPRPGLYKNATSYQRKARWEDGNLIRWHDGSTRPIGGWQRRRDDSNSEIAALIADATLEAIRDMFTWRDLGNTSHVVFGSNLAATHMSVTGDITDITPGGYSASNSSKNASLVAGYGQNPYGIGDYGAGNNLIGQDATPPNRWYFTNFGEILLYGSRRNGNMYEVSPNDFGTITAVTNAPSDVQAAVVTDQRQVFAIGGGGQPRRVQASEVEDRTDWTAATDNQVIDRTIAGSGKFLNCVQVLKDVLIVGEKDAQICRYIGPPYVYDISLAGENCGILAAEAIATTDRFAVWWGERNFWLYDGSIQALPCDVTDFLYSDIDPNQISKVTAFTISDFSEIWWLYQSKSTTTTEVDSYVVWDYKKNIWYTGRLNRTAGLDKGVTLFPIMVNADGEVYNHELRDVFPSGEGDVFVTSGIYELGNGENNLGVRFIYPDAENTGDVTFELITKQFPTDTENTFGPYPYNNPVPTTGAMGRAVKLKANFQSAGAELGVCRLDYAPIGTGKR